MHWVKSLYGGGEGSEGQNNGHRLKIGEAV
jgi:hypothetical protein